MSFWRTKDVKHSQKVRLCEECGHTIEIGDPYRYCACYDDDIGEFYSYCVHAECQIWASNVMNSDEGRGFLRNSDPSEEYELAEAVIAHPPSETVRSRLPAAWLKAVDAILMTGRPIIT